MISLVRLCFLLLALFGATNLAARVPPIYNKKTQPWPKRLFRTYQRHKDLMYARHVSCLMDVYIPKEPLNKEARDFLKERRLPCILFIHGQGFAKVNRRYMLAYKEPIFYGYAMATISYRTTEEAVFPAQVHDCREAVRFLKHHERLLGIDSSHIAVWGVAAGGNLAAMVGALGNLPTFLKEKPARQEKASVAAVVLWSAPTDLTRIERQLWHLFRHESPSYHPIKKMERYVAYVDGPLPEKMETLKEASPINYLDIGDPPVLMHHGYSDTIVPRQQAYEYEKKLKEVGVPTELIVFPHAGHRFYSADVALDKHHPKRKTLEFLDKHLKGRSEPTK